MDMLVLYQTSKVRLKVKGESVTTAGAGIRNQTIRSEWKSTVRIEISPPTGNSLVWGSLRLTLSSHSATVTGSP